jgi:hypothetical protein
MIGLCLSFGYRDFGRTKDHSSTASGITETRNTERAQARSGPTFRYSSGSSISGTCRTRLALVSTSTTGVSKYKGRLFPLHLESPNPENMKSTFGDSAHLRISAIGTSREQRVAPSFISNRRNAKYKSPPAWACSHGARSHSASTGDCQSTYPPKHLQGCPSAESTGAILHPKEVVIKVVGGG